MRNIFFLFLFLLIANLAFAQQSKIDSLEKALGSAVTDSAQINILNSLSVSYRFNDPKKAINYAKAALILLKDTISVEGKRQQAIIYDNLGVPNAVSGNYQQALFYFLTALKIKETINDSLLIAMGYNYLGNVEYYLGNYKKSLEYRLKTLKYNELLNDKRGISMALNNIGQTYGALKEYRQALKYHFRSLRVKKEIKDLEGMTYSYNNLSHVYKKLGLYDSSLVYTEKAIDLNRQVGNIELLIANLINKSDLYSFKKDYESALKYALEGLKVSEKSNYNHRKSMLYKQIANLYDLQNNYEKAYKYLQSYAEIKDSLFNEESTKQIAEMQTKYETEKKEKEIELLNKSTKLQTAELKKKQYVIYSVAGGLLLVLALAFFIFRSYRVKQKANLLLQEQKKKIEQQKQIVEEQHKDIKDSINYAQRIQQAILPSITEIKKQFPESFILYKPKDVVSGDFYWFTKKENQIIIAAVDCTGHGVPGAFMSMIGNDQLNQIIIEKGITQPSEILTQLNKGVKTALKQSDTSSPLGMTSDATRDGMDIALCTIDINSKSLQFAGANRPLYYFKSSNSIKQVNDLENKDLALLTEISSDKIAIGGTTDENYHFSSHNLDFNRGDIIYLFTDGYADQFGGNKGKKVMTKNFKKLLYSIYHLPIQEQKQELEKQLQKWQGDYEQVDDILVLGIRF